MRILIADSFLSDPSIDFTTIDGGQLGSHSPPQPIFTAPVRVLHSASSKRIHGLPLVEKLPIANGNALPSSVNHSNAVSASSDVTYDSKTDYLRKLHSSRTLIYPHTSAYSSGSNSLQQNGAPHITTGRPIQNTSIPMTMDVHSVLDGPNDSKASETRPGSSPCS